MFDAPNLYENDGFYEDTDYEDEYIADDIDYIADDEEDENALWGDEDEPERKKLKRELRAEALARLEDSARTQRDFEKYGIKAIGTSARCVARCSKRYGKSCSLHF